MINMDEYAEKMSTDYKNNMSLSAIARRYKTSQYIVKRTLDKHYPGLRIKLKQHDQIIFDKQAVIDAYCKFKSFRAAGEYIGVSRTRIYQIMKNIAPELINKKNNKKYWYKDGRHKEDEAAE